MDSKDLITIVGNENFFDDTQTLKAFSEDEELRVHGADELGGFVDIDVVAVGG